MSLPFFLFRSMCKKNAKITTNIDFSSYILTDFLFQKRTEQIKNNLSRDIIKELSSNYI